jgi:flavin-dependent dehydrogenase
MSMTYGGNDTNVDSNIECDVTVVGSGPTGTNATYYLALAGINVTVLDELNFPHEKICGDFISPGSIKELQKMDTTQAAAKFTEITPTNSKQVLKNSENIELESEAIKKESLVTFAYFNS